MGAMPSSKLPAGAARKHPRNSVTDLRGASRMAIDAVAGITDLVEEMHRNIAALAPPLGPAPAGGAGGITGMVYKSVRGVTRAVGLGIDAALGMLAPLVAREAVSPRRDAVLAALNGVLGDYLAETGNPLAIPMQLRQHGIALPQDRAALRQALPPATGKVVVLVHGLCMDDLQWLREGHDHGLALQREAGCTAVYLHYNSGRHIAANGREFSAVLQQLADTWPVPLERLMIVGHSMGGLVARGACHFAAADGAGWVKQLDTLVCLGTPHHGAPLERAGHWVDMLTALSPYSAPFTRLGGVRSAGIRDLRHGNVVNRDADAGGATPTFVPLPPDVHCVAVAATRADSGGNVSRLKGDGLVTVRSALGLHADPARTLGFAPADRHIRHGLNHFDLLSNRAVGDLLVSLARTR
jgi:pimeloyl-ACP methyl ester carboxylesterase